MQTASVNSTNSTASASGTSSTSNSTLGQDAFLKMLVAQLKNQDPTNAQDPNQMVSEMATFSSLEAQQNTNSLLASIETQNAALYQAQSADLVGKTIEISSSNVNLSGGSAQIGVNLASAGNATLTIKNNLGQVVATLGPASLQAGDNTLTWNGQNGSGVKLPDGAYAVSVSAASSSGAAITASTTTTAAVTAVSFVNGQVMVTAGGNQYALSNVTQISN